MDRDALSDALYAERLSTSLRDSAAFRRGHTRVSDAELDAYTRRRSEPIRKALSGSDADVQWAIERVRQLWRATPSQPGNERVVSMLAYHARRLLRVDGTDMILDVDRDDPAREILRWRFISLAIPPGILIAAATPKGAVPPAQIRLLHPAMAPDGPVAQLHVHHAAMVSFEELWSGLRLRALREPGRYSEGFREKRAYCPGLHAGTCIGGRQKADRDCGKRYPYARQRHLADWAAMVRLAFVARGVLDRHLQHKDKLATCEQCALGRQTVRVLFGGKSVPYTTITRAYPWPDELVRLHRKQRTREDPHDRNSKLKATSDFATQLARAERVFTARAFERVAVIEAKSSDETYEKLLLQYLRIKCAVFGLLVHPPGEHGLENFLDHFLQIKVYAPDADMLSPRRPEEPGLDVRATEYRVAPDAWFKIRRRAEIERENRPVGSKRPEAGWLIHFKRKPAGEELPLHIGAMRSMDAEADQIARYIETDPTQLRRLRGIDICGVEEMQPCWVVADTLRRLRERSAEIAGRNGHLKLQALRLTLHAGEDFQWLTSGVRAIAEPFVWNLIHRGDRIGHGIAITLDPRKWWSQKSREVVPLKQFDRLLNLAFLAEYVPHPNRDQQEWLRESITLVVKKLRLEPAFAGPPSATVDIDVVDIAKKLWRCLGTPVTRRLMGSPNFDFNGKVRHQEWMHRYLWTPSIHKLADKEIPMLLEDDRVSLAIESDRNELDLLVEARKKLIRQLARWQVCIESNPSSNLVVGSLDSMLAQDFLHRRPTNPTEKTGDETLMWTISTDDPITFSTTLADEYAYAWAGMILRKDKHYDPAYARALLDEAAATSMRTRFTIPIDDSEPRRQHRRGDGGRQD